MIAARWFRALGLAAALLWARGAAARGLSPDQIARLERGETVVLPQTLDRSGQHYVGGVTYTVVEMSPDELLALFDDVDAYVRVLPRTKFARRVAARGRDTFVELHQGNAFIDAAYTLRMRKDPEHREVRFWLDPSRPHAIEDTWGFFHYDPYDAGGAAHRSRILLTYGVLVDLGSGILQSLYEERVRKAMLGVPQLVRRYVRDGRRLASYAKRPGE